MNLVRSPLSHSLISDFSTELIDMAQPIYVKRENYNSRTQTIQDILDRAKSTFDWPQIMIFPEGTCTNGQALIEFKPGAFYPGQSVQPILIRYPNKIDTYTWTWQGKKKYFITIYSARLEKSLMYIG